MLRLSHVVLSGTLHFVDYCSGLLAALGHDIGHGGLNNSFLVRSRDKLAMVYNDIRYIHQTSYWPTVKPFAAGAYCRAHYYPYHPTACWRICMRPRSSPSWTTTSSTSWAACRRRFGVRRARYTSPRIYLQHLFCPPTHVLDFAHGHHLLLVWTALSLSHFQPPPDLHLTTQPHCSQVIVQSILSTDMSHHFKLISETELFYEINESKLTDFTVARHKISRLITLSIPLPSVWPVIESCVCFSLVEGCWDPSFICEYHRSNPKTQPLSIVCLNGSLTFSPPTTPPTESHKRHTITHSYPPTHLATSPFYPGVTPGGKWGRERSSRQRSDNAGAACAVALQIASVPAQACAAAAACRRHQ